MNSLNSLSAQGGAQSPIQASVIDDRVNRLRNVIAELGELVSGTIAKLEPIIVPYPTDTATKANAAPPRPVQSAHASNLENLADDVERITSSLRGAMSNAQI